LKRLVIRLVQGLGTLVAMSVIVFVAVYLIGSPAELLVPPQASQAEAAQIASALGLDQPLPVQYLRFIERALAGDLGRSFITSTPALALIAERLPATLELACAAALLAVGLGIPLGLWSALRPQGRAPRLTLLAANLGYSMPTFWTALLLVMLFSVHLEWLPAGGRDAHATLLGVHTSFASLTGLAHLALPASSLALFKLSLIVRVTHAAARDALGADHVRHARARGLTDHRILTAHVLSVIAAPLLAVIGLEFGSLVAFSVVTESVFAWPGAGRLLIDAIANLDRPVIVAYLLATVVLFTLINLAADLAAIGLDPRLRREAGR
jgi:peptide/nickel transport system permease protein